jgi:hypothetical protein
MSDDLTKAIMGTYNAASERLGEMHRAVVDLLPDLTPDEMGTWSDIEERIKEHHDQTKQLFDDINVLRSTDPKSYFERLHASIERQTDVIKSFNDEIFKLVRNHSKAVQDWKENHPPDSLRQIKRHTTDRTR